MKKNVYLPTDTIWYPAGGCKTLLAQAPLNTSKAHGSLPTNIAPGLT